MTFDELKERVSRIHRLLQEPEPGLISYQLAVGNLMQELVDKWTGKDATK